jgi:hypothetical protein
MKRKLIVLSSITAIIVLLTSVTPAVASTKFDGTTADDLVTIEVNTYYGKQPQTSFSKVTSQEAEQMENELRDLSNAQQQNNQQSLSQHRSLFSKLGVSEDMYQRFIEQNKKVDLLSIWKSFGTTIGDNISNSMCFFTAIGEGFTLFTLGVVILRAMIGVMLNVSSPVGKLILMLVLLPLLISVMLFTDLIPFRILTPSGSVSLQNGTMSTTGLLGHKKLSVGIEPVNVNVSVFTGITINIPSINGHKPFLFMSGFALGVKEASA